MITPVARDGLLRGADVDEEFMALVCADEELLDAEFEAIIAAGWPPPPPPRPRSLGTAERGDPPWPFLTSSYAVRSVPA